MNHLYALLHGPHTPSVISRPKAGALTHVGILLPDGRVAHCAPGRGEHLSSVEEFAVGQDVTIVEEIPQSLRAATIKRIAHSMRTPQGYHATTNNCEIFVNRMLGRQAVSPQLNAAVLIGTLALIGLAVAA